MHRVVGSEAGWMPATTRDIGEPGADGASAAGEVEWKEGRSTMGLASAVAMW